MHRQAATWLGGALLCALIAGLGLLSAPGSLLAAPGGEVWGHAWVQWWHGQALPDWPAGTDRATGAEHWPVIDPLWTLLLAALGRGIGVVAAWNVGQLLAVGGAFLGGAWLARREGGEPLLGGLALALAPALLGSLASGLSEDAAVGLAAVGLGLVGHRSWKRGLLAGLCLGLLAGCGLVLAWQAAVVAVGFGLGAGIRDRRSLPATVAGGLLAALLAAPVALLQGSRLAGEGHRLGQVQAQVEPLWRLNPWRGVDLASFVTPLPQDAGDALARTHPGYLGLSLLLLAVFAGRSRWWPVLVGAVLVAPGDHLSWAGQPLGIDNPFAGLLDLLPGGSLVNHHGRLLLVGAVALSVLAARGLARLRARFGTPALVGGLALVGLDLVLLAPGGAPLPTADPTPPAVAAQLSSLSPGSLLVLPASGPGVHFQRPLFDQRVHRRRLLLNPTRPGIPEPFGRTPTGRWAGGLAAPHPPPPPQQLDFMDIGAVLVMEPWVDAAAAVLGPPDLRGPDAAAWDAQRPAAP